MKILVSQCLLGSACRWDGQPSADLLSWLSQHGILESEILALCPETLGDLSTPRPPVEIVGGRGASCSGKPALRHKLVKIKRELF